MENTTLVQVAYRKDSCTAVSTAQVLAPADLGANPDSAHIICVT